MGRLGVLMVDPALGQHVFLFRLQQRKLANLLHVAVQPLFRAGCWQIGIGAHFDAPS